MSFAAYFSSIYTLLGLAGLVLVCAFAWWKGGPPERLGTLMLALSWIGADVVRGFSGQMVPTITLFVSDILISAGFLYIAIRYSSLWLGGAMMFRAIGFAVHAAQLNGDEDAPRWHGWIIYLLINNVLSYLVLLTLAGGTLATILQRRRQAEAQAKAKVAAEARAASRARGLITVPPQPPAAAT